MTNLTELPERERFKICHAFYPLSNEYVLIDERDKCYEQFGIKIKTSEIYDKCHDKIDDLSDYKNCHDMLGSKPKTDSCWMTS